MLGLGLKFYNGYGASAPIATGPDTYVHTQASPATVWNVAHGLGGFAVVQVLLNTGEVVVPTIDYVDANNITCTFTTASTGTVLCARQADLEFEFTTTADESFVHGEDFSGGTQQMIATVWLDLGGGNYRVAYPSLEELNDLNYRITWSAARSGFVSMVIGERTDLNPFTSPENVVHNLGAFPLVGLIANDGVTKLVANVVHNTVNDLDITSLESALSYLLAEV